VHQLTWWKRTTFVYLQTLNTTATAHWIVFLERSCLSESGDNTSQPCGRTDAIQDDVFTDVRLFFFIYLFILLQWKWNSEVNSYRLFYWLISKDWKWVQLISTDQFGLVGRFSLCQGFPSWVTCAPRAGFFEENVRYPVWTCRDPIFNSRDPIRVPKTP